MPLGYFGHATIAGVNLLVNSTGLNRQVNPLMSRAVWGAGWYNAAAVTNYADSQMHFEGPINFELQGVPLVWNLIRDWLIERRAFPQSARISPNGVMEYRYETDVNDYRTGLWMSQATININNTALVTVSGTCIGLKRKEFVNGVENGPLVTNFYPMGVNPARAGSPAARDQGLRPVAPLNPAPRNLNPIPGWDCQAQVVWPAAAPFWADPGNVDGMVLMQTDIRVNNNTQVIRGCTGDIAPVAVIQGTINAEGTMNLWRPAGISDPYRIPGNFSAVGASVIFRIGINGAVAFATASLPHVLLTSDEYNIAGQNDPVSRNFGYAALGDGNAPPFIMAPA
jgi:hypothetical protein